MSALDVARRTWSQEDKTKLIQYWGELGSIILIALILNRPEGSVQTEASRLNLPRRIEDGDNHRKKWTDADRETLQSAMNMFRTPDGKVRILEVSSVTGRSVDAITTLLAKEAGCSRDDLRPTLHIPDDVEDIKKQIAKSRPVSVKPVTDTRKLTKMRNCLCCTLPFWSEGAGNRICPRCKSDIE